MVVKGAISASESNSEYLTFVLIVRLRGLSSVVERETAQIAV